MASLSVVPPRLPYSSSGMVASTRRRTLGQPPTWPLCMNRKRPAANGWQLARLVAVPVAARTWAKNARLRTVAARECRFSSDQAGRSSRYNPGAGRSPYQPMPNPSPLISVLPSAACIDWWMRLWDGAHTTVSIRMGAPW